MNKNSAPRRNSGTKKTSVPTSSAGRVNRGKTRGPMHRTETGTSDLHEIGKGPAPLSASLKEGFAREEGGQGNARRPQGGRGGRDNRGGRQGGRGGRDNRGGGGGAFAISPRMHTFKNKPFHKTGSDDNVLEGSPNDRLRVIVLGGNEEVGRNCTLLEYGNDIIMIDCGLQFPDEDMPGVDYIIPNISYLRGKEKNVRAVIITHAHYDHIGGIPHVVPRIGNPPVFATDLTCGIINKRQQDHHDGPALKLNTIKTDDVLQLGVFKVEFFGVAHSMAASTGVIVHTPAGILVHTGDFKLETGPSAQSVQETEKIKALGEQNVLALMIDSTNASAPGRQIGEHEIQTNIDEIISKAPGRIIIGTFASMISRIQQILLACERNGRKVAVEGFSMRSNIAIAQELGYMKVAKGLLIDTKQINDYPPEKVAIICTGAQGESRAALMRMANREHPFVSIQPTDTVVFSSSVIPGNERTVQRVKDILCREGADVIHYKMMDVHAGGHAKQEDLQEMHDMVKPKYIIPIEGHYSFLVDHAKAAMENGFPKNRIFIADNGQIMEFDKKGEGVLTNRKVPTEFVFVDGLGVGDVSHVVLRDRQELSADGIAIIVAVIERRSGQLLALPDIISRGFVHMKEQQDLVNLARRYAAKLLKDNDPKVPADPAYLKDKLRDEMGEFFFKKTERRPMILPVIVEV